MSDMAREDPFFIGWLPVPKSYSRFLRNTGIVFILAAAGVSLFTAQQQDSPGSGEWDDQSVQEFAGIVHASPYAMIRVAGNPVRTILLVEAGKFGASERVKPFDGQAVRVKGTLLHRDDRQMVELVAGEDAITPIELGEDQANRLRRPAPRELGDVVLHGEIIDSKCYLGAMKPGGGKTHKACAALCLSGGIPPMFVTPGPDRREAFYLLVDENGGPLTNDALKFVGDPVELRARLETIDDLSILRVPAGGIRRR